MPVTPNMKIAEVLKQYPQLLDVLLAQSDHFGKLKNPVLRRIHGRLVTVAQAAAVAGIDPALLVRRLNMSLGEECSTTATIELASTAGAPPPLWLTSAKIAVEVDAREDQRRHEDPFTKIMAAITKVGQGEVLLLRNTFEPLPLYDVLSKRGFLAWSREVSAQDWEVYFFRAGKDINGHGTVRGASDKAPMRDVAHGTEPAATITVDVRELVPPQPMLRILEALDRLQPGETLLVHHVRQPVYLYPKLAELGYRHETRELGPDRVDIVISR